MYKKFLKLNLDNDEADFIASHHPNAFILLYFIARRARRTLGLADGLVIGQCHLGDHKSFGLTEREYRTAKEVLCKRSLIKIVETCRTRKKSTTGTTTVGTLVQLLDSRVWDINAETNDDRNDERPTTDRRPTDEEQERRRKKKKREDHPSIPSGRSDPMSDDFSFEKEKIEIIPGVFLTSEDLEVCIQLKGDIEKVKQAVYFIQGSPKRKHAITDWPGTIARWKIESNPTSRIDAHLALAETLSRTFQNYHDGRGWRCFLYTDKKKDQRGLLFENQSPFKESIFIALTDGDFKKKCEEAIENNRMKKQTNLDELKIMS